MWRLLCVDGRRGSGVRQRPQQLHESRRDETRRDETRSITSLYLAPCACCSGSLRVALLYGTRRDESLLRALTLGPNLIYYESALVSG